MPRPRDHASNVTSAVEGLLRAVTSLVDEVGKTVSSSVAVRGAASGVGSAAREVGTAAKAKSARLRRSLRAYWKKMKGKARKARIAGMHKRKAPRRKAK